MSSNPCIHVSIDYGSGDIKRQSGATAVPCGSVETGRSPWQRAWLRPRQYAGSVCDDSAADAEYAAIVAMNKIIKPYFIYLLRRHTKEFKRVCRERGLLGRWNPREVRHSLVHFESGFDWQSVGRYWQNNNYRKIGQYTSNNEKKQK